MVPAPPSRRFSPKPKPKLTAENFTLTLPSVVLRLALRDEWIADLAHVGRDTARCVVVDAILTVAHQGFARDLQQHPLVPDVRYRCWAEVNFPDPSV